VVVDEPFNWRGDWYFVYLVPADFTPERLARERGAANSLLKPVLGNNRWSPPVILQDASGEYWLIDRGEPYELMPDWKVYTPARDRMVVKCRISFGYSPAADVSRMLPNVRNLAKALDEALGPGTGEGTLQQTAALRSEVAKAWANASLRPWALTDEPYNSRTEVEHGLEEWARGSAPRTALLDRIRKTYPSAERELGSYYRRAFEHSHQSAERLARKVLDHMLRSYFVFSKSRLGAA
jgi:hypothetical protein